MYNDEQQQAIDYFGGPLRIIAGAGSGKTRVVTAKIAKIIKEEMCQEWQVLAITFTNKAANEMKHRITDSVGHKPMSHISTYHSLCLNILRQDIKKIGYEDGFTVIDGIDKKQIIKSLLNANKNWKIDKLPVITKRIDSFKKSQFTVEDVAIELENDPYVDIYVALYDAYLNRLLKENYLDFDDLIFKVEELFEKSEEAREKWAKKFKYIFVDEFQDTDNVQYNIVRMLSKYAMLVVVGDPDQTIYTWRGANAKIINNLDKDYKDLKTIILHLNYRSNQSILDVANAVIKNNENRIPKQLLSEKKSDALPYYYAGFSADDEANWVTHAIKNLNTKGVELKDIAVLFRAAYISRSIEQKLVSKNINYRIYGNVRFMERAEIKDSIAYLKAVVEQDDTSLERVINVPARKIGSVSVARLWNAAERLDTSLYNVVFNHKDSWGGAQAGIQSFVDAINAVDKKKPLDQILMDVLHTSGYIDDLKRPSNESKYQNVLELVEWIQTFFRENSEATAKDFFQEVSINSNDSEDDISDKVTLMTLHAAKGLEFKHVFMIGLNEGIFPSIRANSDEPTNFEEERRLFYVGATRAMDQLYMSSYAGRSFTGDLMIPSRFIGEIDTWLYQEPKTHSVKKLAEPENLQPINMREKFVEYSNGDDVYHTVFGKGLVLNCGPILIQIAFQKPHGVKTIKKQHKALSHVPFE